MRVISTTILAIAALAASATAASLDVEPVESSAPLTAATVDQHIHSVSLPNATSNSTSGHKISPNYRCNKMANANWGDYKYACSWKHDVVFYTYYNQFFMRWDGSVLYDCDCDKNLDQWKPWGPEWTYSNANSVYCYSKDGRTDAGVQHMFDAYGCSG